MVEAHLAVAGCSLTARGGEKTWSLPIRLPLWSQHCCVSAGLTLVQPKVLEMLDADALQSLLGSSPHLV